MYCLVFWIGLKQGRTTHIERGTCAFIYYVHVLLLQRLRHACYNRCNTLSNIPQCGTCGSFASWYFSPYSAKHVSHDSSNGRCMAHYLSSLNRHLPSSLPLPGAESFIPRHFIQAFSANMLDMLPFKWAKRQMTVFTRLSAQT